MADQFTPLPIKTKTNGDVIIKVVDSAGTNIAAVDATGHIKVVNDSTTNAGAVVKTSDFDTGAGTDTVTMFGIALPKSGGAVAGGTSTDPVRVDPTGTTTQPVSQGTAAAGTGAWPVAVTDTTNTIVKPGDSGNNAIRVNVVAGSTSTAPASPKFSALTSASLAAGSPVTLFGTAISTATGRLAQVVVSSSVPCKWEIATSANGSTIATTPAVVFTSAATLTDKWTPPHPNYITRASGTGACFAIKITNMDNNNAADVYATLIWDES